MGKLFFLLLTLFSLFVYVFYKNNAGNENMTHSPPFTATTSEKRFLSHNARFPSPVIQLQQTLAIDLEGANLPTLNGNIAELLPGIEEDAPPPSPELDELKKRLNKLQGYSQKE